MDSSNCLVHASVRSASFPVIFFTAVIYSFTLPISLSFGTDFTNTITAVIYTIAHWIAIAALYTRTYNCSFLYCYNSKLRSKIVYEMILFLHYLTNFQNFSFQIDWHYCINSVACTVQLFPFNIPLFSIKLLCFSVLENQHYCHICQQI